MTDQLSALDLNALEREYSDYVKLQDFTADRVTLTLIRRLREAEEALRQAVALDFKRKAQLSEAEATIQTNLAIHAADIALIGRLESLLRDYLHADMDAFSPTELRHVRERVLVTLEERAKA